MSISQQGDPKFPSVLLFGDTSVENNKNTFILISFRPEDLMNLYSMMNPYSMMNLYSTFNLNEFLRLERVCGFQT